MKLILLSLAFCWFSLSVASTYSELDSRNYDLVPLLQHDEYSPRVLQEFEEWDHGVDEFSDRSESQDNGFSAGDEFKPHADNELALRDDRVDLVPRIVQLVAKQLVQNVIKFAIKGIGSLVKDIKDERKTRETFVKNLLAGLVAKNTSFNYMIIHPKHTANWEGARGEKWWHEHAECDTIRLFKKTVEYEVYAGKEGVVTLKGDGGFNNWAFWGNFDRSGNQGHVVTFCDLAKPGPCKSKK
ncbi:hypothetical protein C8J56DRAFT_1101344 [Mycena floridula]|nr:hypothetical protein C8J56DRAFT_1101344 [Mycena floridula]